MLSRFHNVRTSRALQIKLTINRTYAKMRASTLTDENNNKISCTRAAHDDG